jgi:hypothetical protein
MDNLNLTPTPTPTPTPTVNKGLIGSILGFVGFIIFGLPLGVAALILGVIDTPKNTWSYVSIVMGIIDIVGVLYVLGSY